MIGHNIDVDCAVVLDRNGNPLSPGISFKTQALYAAVFVTRYLDLFTTFVSLYNSLMKIFFIGSAFYILFLMKNRFKATWDPKLDTLRVEFLIIPCVVLSLISAHKYTVQEVGLSEGARSLGAQRMGLTDGHV